jgi:hypothetical protein
MLTWPQLGTLLLLLLLLFSRTCVNIWSLLVIIMGMHPDYTLPPTHETIPFDLIRAVLDQAARSPLKPMAIKLFDRQSLTTPRNTVPALEPGSTEPPTELSATLPEEVLGTHDNVLARLENIWGVQIGGANSQPAHLWAVLLLCCETHFTYCAFSDRNKYLEMAGDLVPLRDSSI